MRHNSITKLMFCAVLGMVQPSIMDDVPTFFAAFCSIFVKKSRSAVELQCLKRVTLACSHGLRTRKN